MTLGKNGVQISNFIFSFILIFELCIKISDSEKFIVWIGSNLDQSIRYLIMFVILLIKPHGLFGTEEVERV